jgi:hypothetical protein
MSIKLRIAVRRNNVRQAIAALRVVPNPATEPEDDLTPAGASLHERLDRIQLRSATRNRRTPSRGAGWLTNWRHVDGRPHRGGADGAESLTESVHLFA